MTTGEFRSVPIDIIWVDQDERQRSKLDGVDRIRALSANAAALSILPSSLAIIV